jgi:hypothetical protein
VVRRLRLEPWYDWFMWTWDDGTWVPVVLPDDDVPVSAELLRALDEWHGILRATYDEDLRDSWSGFDTLEELRAFRKEGKRLLSRIQRELGPEYEVVYDPHGDARVRVVPKPPKKKPTKRLGRDPGAGPHRP